MTLERIEQHTERSVLELADPFWGKPRVAAFLSAFTDRIQALEDDLWEILESRTIADGDLVRLKVLGKLIGQPRLTFELEVYRKVLEARARANVSRGRPSDIRAVLRILVDDVDFDVLTLGNATMYVMALAPIDDTRPIAAVLPDTRSAGVGLHFMFSDADPDEVFIWGDDWADTETWASVAVM